MGVVSGKLGASPELFFTCFGVAFWRVLACGCPLCFFCAEPATNCIDAVNLAAAGRRDTGLIALEPDDTAGGDVVFTPTISG